MRLWTFLASLALSLALTGCATLGGGGTAQSTADFKDDDEFRAWFAFYYKAPHPEQVTAALKFMSKSGYLEDDKKTMGRDTPVIASVFFARVFAAHPAELESWSSSWASFGEKEWNVLLISLWMTDSDPARKVLHANLDRVKGEHRQRLREMVEHNPSTIDPLKAEVVDPRQIALLWAAYSATGDERYVTRVLGYVRYFGEEPEEKSDIGEMAINTLAINSLQHEGVTRLCTEALQGPDPKTRVLMKAMFNAIAQMKQEAAGEGEAAEPAH